MKSSVRTWALLATFLLLSSIIVLNVTHPMSAQEVPIEITDVKKPTEIPQAAWSHVSAQIYNSLNDTVSGFAQFVDNLGEITSHAPDDPTSPTYNFTIGPRQTFNLVLNYSVEDNATLGLHWVTFEISIEGFSFLLSQYQLLVVPVARILSVTAGQVLFQGQPGIVLATIENRINRTRTVQIKLHGEKFVNITQNVDLSPGQNVIALSLQPTPSHFYDFGMFPLNLSIYYEDELISSRVTLVPVDMTFVNKVLGVILPILIFEVLVVFYAYRKMQRMRLVTES